MQKQGRQAQTSLSVLYGHGVSVKKWNKLEILDGSSAHRSVDNWQANFAKVIGIGGPQLLQPPLPHHRACGSAPGGSRA
jgi:hypothetical protein